MATHDQTDLVLPGQTPGAGLVGDEASEFGEGEPEAPGSRERVWGSAGLDLARSGGALLVSTLRLVASTLLARPADARIDPRIRLA